jgi:nucleoside-diphosphate-sugar epimerase
MATIAITGSSGFIGKHLVQELVKSGNDLTLIDLDIGYDVTNFFQMNALPGFDIAIHLAAKTFVPDAYNDPRLFYHINVLGTLNMLELCRLRGARMILLSSYIYGHPEYLPIDENHPFKAFNPYSQSKIIAEQLCQAFHHDFHVPVIILRPFNLYGIFQHDNFLIPKIISQAIQGHIQLEDPRPRRDFIYVMDLIEAIIQAIDYRDTDFDIFNVGSGISYSVEEVAGIIIDKFNPDAKVTFSNSVRKNEVLNTIADISKIRAKLNWIPKTNFRIGIELIHQLWKKD